MQHAQTAPCASRRRLAPRSRSRDDRHDAVRAQLRHVVGAARQSVEARAAAQQRGRAQRDVTAADQQYPHHPVDPIPRRAPSSAIAAPGRVPSNEALMQIIIKPSDHSFACAADETVLQAAMRADLMIPYGCRNGACGTCKGTHPRRHGRLRPVQPTTLTEDDKQQRARALLLRAPARATSRSKCARCAAPATSRSSACRAASSRSRVPRTTSPSCGSSCRPTSGCSSSPGSTSTSC